MSFEQKIRIIADAQRKYQELLKGGHVSKKEMCEVGIPLRDALGISDVEALSVMRANLSLSLVIDLIDNNNSTQPTIPVYHCSGNKPTSAELVNALMILKAECETHSDCATCPLYSGGCIEFCILGDFSRPFLDGTIDDAIRRISNT